MSRKRRPTDAIATAILSFYRSWVIIGLPVALLQNGGLPFPLRSRGDRSREKRLPRENTRSKPSQYVLPLLLEKKRNETTRKRVTFSAKR